jgi:hypothetical protein
MRTKAWEKWEKIGKLDKKQQKSIFVMEWTTLALL